jgi:gamma-glutamyl-gamma-aminobutyrate hydrolase PuuD
MGHRKYEHPKKGTLGFVPRRRAPSQTATAEQVLAMGGIVAGPYGTPGYEHARVVAGPVPLRSEAQRKEVSARISRRIEQRRNIERQAITIAHREDAHGAGAFWDHYTLRNATGRETTLTHSAAVAPVVTPPGPRKARQFAGPLPGGDPIASTDPGSGLLFIAGGNYGLTTELPAPNKDHVPEAGSAKTRHEHRAQHERQLLLLARRTGRPVLAVCGGSWRLLEAFGGRTRGVKPHTHQTRQMPYLTSRGAIAKVASTHGVSVARGSLLSSIFRDDAGVIPARVNSAHWAVAEESRLGQLYGVPRFGQRLRPLLRISARGHTGADAPYLGAPRRPFAQSVEAFETAHGAPMMGIQWHPEAYDRGFSATEHQANRRILTYMAQAGDAYEARREMTTEFSRWVGMRRLQPRYLARNAAFQVARRNAQL